jgi:Rrf2 family protein
MFSKACEYGIKATLYVATQSLQDKRVNLKDIAREINSPEAFTAKILQQLARHGVVDSVKGPNGGFQIGKNRLHEVKLSEIVSAIDGDNIYRGCGLGLEQCNAKQPCPLHDKFVGIRNDLRKMLESTSLYELATGLEVGLTFLVRSEP